MKHSHKVNNYNGSHEQLAEEMGDLYYDSLAQLLRMLSRKMARDGEQDQARGRRQLATALANSAAHLQQAAEEIDTAWRICKPHVDQHHNPHEP